MSARRGNRQAFTLIEIMASMAVLLILVLLVGRVFRDSATAWTAETKRSEGNMMARAALDFMTRDIQQAVADQRIAFRLNSYDFKVFSDPNNSTWDDIWNDALYFVALNNDPNSSTPRAARQVIYYVTNMVDEAKNVIQGRYRLMRSEITGAQTCYETNSYWWEAFGKGGSQPIIENVGSLEIWCYGSTNDAAGKAYYKNVPSYNSPSDPLLMSRPPPAGGQEPENQLRPFQMHKTPAWIEVFVSVMDEEDSVRAKALFDAGRYVDSKNYMNRYGKRYAIRINIPQGRGYTGDR